MRTLYQIIVILLTIVAAYLVYKTIAESHQEPRAAVDQIKIIIDNDRTDLAVMEAYGRMNAMWGVKHD